MYVFSRHFQVRWTPPSEGIPGVSLYIWRGQNQSGLTQNLILEIAWNAQKHVHTLWAYVQTWMINIFWKHFALNYSHVWGVQSHFCGLAHSGSEPFFFNLPLEAHFTGAWHLPMQVMHSAQLTVNALCMLFWLFKPFALVGKQIKDGGLFAKQLELLVRSNIRCYTALTRPS